MVCKKNKRYIQSTSSATLLLVNETKFRSLIVIDMKLQELIHQDNHIVGFTNQIEKGKKGWLNYGSVETLHQIIITKRVVDLLNDTENKGPETYTDIIGSNTSQMPYFTLETTLTSEKLYNYYFYVNPDLNKVIRIARNYILITQREISLKENGSFRIDYEEIEKKMLYICYTKVYCKKSSNSMCSKCLLFQHLYCIHCPYRDQLWPSSFNNNLSINISAEYDYSELVCMGNAITRDDQEVICDYYFITKLIV
ncbi:hypothetical protein GLOIN_2v1495169 [Rhizophagus clarus]|uniref:Uncharacterized protein n=1 Tax=Rhizophagus clarus TaxID=94130 RepID=A0A8H3L8D7_9GLOM|nr:hypothetical protein GLOIN_2v1495169 [Rhizophagus clarus]